MKQRFQAVETNLSRYITRQELLAYYQLALIGDNECDSRMSDFVAVTLAVTAYLIHNLTVSYKNVTDDSKKMHFNLYVEILLILTF